MNRQTMMAAFWAALPLLALAFSPAPVGLSLVLFFCLWVLSVWDLMTFRLPNTLTAAFLGAGLLYIYMAVPDRHIHHLVGALVGLVFFPIVNACYRMLRDRDGIGMGDAKLLSGIGLWLGWASLPAILLVASLSGLAYALGVRLKKNDKNAADRIPFGPFLSLACWVVWLDFPQIY